MGMLDLLNQWDKDLFLYLNGLHNTLWDYVLTLFTLTPVWIPFYLVILAIIVKKYGKKSLWIILCVTLMILFADQFSGILKHTVKRLRPSNDPEISQLAHVFFTKGGLYGFVSAHAANSFSFATFSILLFKNSRYTFFIIPWAMMIAYSRIYLGVHYPGDVLGGAILGIMFGIGIYKLLIYTEGKFSPLNPFVDNTLTLKEARTIVATGLMVIALCLMIISLLMNYQLLKVNC
jgi:undecaprenyl-diphosphatase